MPSIAITGGLSHDQENQLKAIGAVRRSKNQGGNSPLLEARAHYELPLPIAKRLFKPNGYKIDDKSADDFQSKDLLDNKSMTYNPPSFMSGWESKIITQEMLDEMDSDNPSKELMQKLMLLRSFNIDQDAIDMVEDWEMFEQELMTLKAMDMEFINRVLNRNGIHDDWWARTPKPHQKAGMAFFLLSFEYGVGHICLFDEMRTGKTLQATCIARWLLERKLIKRVLVICPNTIKRVWQNELCADAPLHGIFSIIPEGSKQEKQNLWRDKAYFWIINYECARSDKNYMDYWCQVTDDEYLLIVDEAHKVKNPEAKQSQAILDLTPKFSVFMTGTPVANRPEDAFSMADFVSPGILGASYYDFFEQFATKGGYSGKDVIGYKNLNEVKHRLARLSMRRKRADIMFDSKVRQSLSQPLQDDQLTAYESMRDLLFASVVNDDSMTTVSVNNKLVQSLRLTQICDGYVSSNPSDVNWLKKNWKFEALDEFVEDYLDDVGKLVIWSRFVPVVKTLCDKYAYTYGATSIYGDVKGEERTNRMYKFQQDPDCRIMVAQINSAGLGMGFQPATFCIFVDKWWSPASNLQAEDRIVGIMNPVPVTVISLVSADCIDERWEYILSRKKEWADEITGDTNTDVSAPPKFDRDTLLYLLAPAKDAEKFKNALEAKWEVIKE